MSKPWEGNGMPARPEDFTRAAEQVGCEEAVIRAVWKVEAAGRGFLRDGTLIRRFEPHKMPGATSSWRDSLKIGPTRREQLFLEAFDRKPMEALRASSWGGPQIMGFNAQACGFANAREMVERMARSEGGQIAAFVTLVKSWGLDSALRAHDWRAFEERYNGGGFNGKYAKKMEAAYRGLTGKSSPTVIRMGSSGEAVRRAQEALGADVDGRFGPETAAAVRRFQDSAGLKVDGVVGKNTWAALECQRQAKPTPQKTTADEVADQVKKWGAVASGASAAAAGVQEVLPSGAYDLLLYGAVALGLIAAGAFVLRQVRGAA